MSIGTSYINRHVARRPQCLAVIQQHLTYSFHSSLANLTMSFVKGYKLWRSRPKWLYPHPELANDCARKGGCCGRDCGRCESRGRIRNRPRPAGHCTVDYDSGCCARSRGFGIDRKDVLKAQEICLSALDNQTRRGYSSRILQAYFFGVDVQADVTPRWIKEHEV